MDCFLPDDVLQSAVLERVEPVRDAPTGVHGLMMASRRTLGLARTTGGQVEMMFGSADGDVTGVRLSPAEAKWLRETLVKIGY